ncbi:unnamed protein product, partial [Brachionus calyciflorus]
MNDQQNFDVDEETDIEEEDGFDKIYELCLNKKGGEAILIDDYMYNHHTYNTVNDTDYWRCANRPCGASATTYYGRAKLNKREHFHDCLSDVELKIMRKLEELKDLATKTDTPIPKLYYQARAELIANDVDPVFLSMHFPQLISIQKCLYKFRNAHMPARVSNTDEIVLEGEFTLCQDGKFLLRSQLLRVVEDLVVVIVVQRDRVQITIW